MADTEISGFPEVPETPDMQGSPGTPSTPETSRNSSTALSTESFGGSRARVESGEGWWLQRVVLSFVRFIREIVAELRKVIWPSRQELITYTTVVVVFVVILVAIVAGLDFGFARLTLWLFG